VCWREHGVTKEPVFFSTSFIFKAVCSPPQVKIYIKTKKRLEQFLNMMEYED